MILSEITKTAMSNQWVRYAGVLIVGVTIGVIFYPSKNIKETLTKHYEQQIQTINEQHSQQLTQVIKTYSQTVSDMKTKQSQSDASVKQLTTQVSQLQSHKKTTYYKIVHPDGTIEIRASTEADQDQSSSVSTQIQAEYQQKLQEQQTQLQVTHQQEMTTLQQSFDQKESTYKQQIEDLQKTKSVTTNPKKFGVEGGMLTDKDYYGHVSYDVWGPFFLGLHTQFGPSDSAVGAGIGLRF